jgi:hypothetical protein
MQVIQPQLETRMLGMAMLRALLATLAPLWRHLRIGGYHRAELYQKTEHVAAIAMELHAYFRSPMPVLYTRTAQQRTTIIGLGATLETKSSEIAFARLHQPWQHQLETRNSLHIGTLVEMVLMVMTTIGSGARRRMTVM